MALEKRLPSIVSQLLTVDGTVVGIVKITGQSCLFKVKQKVKLQSDTISVQDFEVKLIPDADTVVVGPISKPISERSDISAFTTADNAFLFSIEQKRPSIPFEEYSRAVYEEEPTVALRMIPVDKLGNLNTADNPMFVQLSDGSIEIGTVNAEVEVQLSHQDNVPDVGDVADSVQVGDGTTIAKIDPENRSFSVNTYEKLLPLMANSKFINLSNIDAIVPVFSNNDNTATLQYMKNGDIVARAIFRFETDIDWDITLESFINDDGGAILLDDDDSELLLD